MFKVSFTCELKIDQSRKLGQQKLSETYTVESDFIL